jgi:4-hydroxy-3-polyprenylbenzoate decarboxylase
MPVAVVLGGDPATMLAMAAPVPPAVDPLGLAGLLREKPLDVVACRSVDLQVPAEADVVIEGYINPAEPPTVAGPLGTTAGYASRPCPAPILHVAAVTYRANRVYPATVPGPANCEVSIVDRALARIFLPLVKLAIPEMVDFDLPLWGEARRLAVLAIRKTYAGQARRVASTAWGLRQFLFAKLLVVVDEGVDVQNAGQVLAAVSACVNPGRDVFFQEGPADGFDPAVPAGVLAKKMAIDATEKLADEYGGSPPEPCGMSREIRDLVSGRWPQYGLGPEL